MLCCIITICEQKQIEKLKLSLKEQESLEKFVLNPIVIENKPKQNDNNKDKDDMNFVSYNKTATKHENILSPL